MIAGLAAWLERCSMPVPIARWIARAIVICAIGLIVWAAAALWLGQHDQAVTARDRAVGNAQAAAAALSADRAAGAAQDARDRAWRNEQTQIEEDVDAAADNGASPLDALFNRLR